MSNFNEIIDVLHSFLWIAGFVFVFLITLLIMKRMIFGKSVYRSSSSGNKDLKNIALYSSIFSSSDGGKD